MANVLDGPKLLSALIAAGIVQGDKLQRVVLDIPYDGCVTMYVQRLGDERLLSIDLQAGLTIEGEVEP